MQPLPPPKKKLSLSSLFSPCIYWHVTFVSGPSTFQLLARGCWQHPQCWVTLFIFPPVLSLQSATIAPALSNRLRYHVFFLHHSNDNEWVAKVAKKLESPSLGFKCCCLERDLDSSKLSLFQIAQYGIHNSRKTVLVLSADFVMETWNGTEPPLLSERDVLLIHKDLVLVLLQECDVPGVLADLVYVDVGHEDWWSQLLYQIQGSRKYTKITR